MKNREIEVRRTILAGIELYQLLKLEKSKKTYKSIKTKKNEN
jgi:hypothetical protein